VLIAMSVVSALIWMPTSAIAVALPAVHDELDSSFTALQWMINAYTLAVAALLVLMGRIGDIYGRRLLFVIGGVTFSAGSLVAAVAPATGWLIVGVGIAGVGAAMAGPASLALVVDAFPPSSQGRAVGIWGAASGIGSALGPMVGGGLTDAFDWRAVFWINVPLIALAVVFAIIGCKESRTDDVEQSVDTPGAATFGAGLTALILACTQGGTWGWGSPGVIALFVASAVLLGTFVAIDLRARSPLIRFRDYRARSFVISTIVLLLGNIVLASLLFLLPLYLQNILDESAIATGLLLLPATATLMVLSPISGWLTDRFGPRWPMVAGILVAALGSFLLSRVDAGSDPIALLPGLLVIGVGFGLEITPVNVAAVQAVPERVRATASGVLLTTGMVGATLGIAAFGALLGGIARADLPENLAAVGVSLPAGEVETLDKVVVGSERAQDVLDGSSTERADRIDEAVDETFVGALQDVLLVQVALQLVAALVALGLPKRARAPAPSVTPAVSTS
jgi:EmrB/QacA subfamily drug resistance transporter